MSPLSRNPRDATIQSHDGRRWGRCRASLRGRPLVVTSTGLRSTGGSLSQRLGSVRSWLTILSGVVATRYGVTVCAAVDILTNRLRVGSGGSAGVAAGMILYGVDVLSMA